MVLDARDAERNLLDLDLQRLGIYERNLQDIIFTDDNKDLVFAVLAGWLVRTRYALTAADICSALGSPIVANEAIPVLRKLLYETPKWWFLEDDEGGVVAGESLVRDHASSSLGALVSPKHANEFISMAIDSTLGALRFAIILELRRTKDPAVPEILRSLLNDSTVAAFAAEALGRIKYVPALADLRQRMTDEDENIARESKIAVRKIEHSTAKHQGPQA